MIGRFVTGSTSETAPGMRKPIVSPASGLVSVCRGIECGLWMTGSCATTGAVSLWRTRSVVRGCGAPLAGAGISNELLACISGSTSGYSKGNTIKTHATTLCSAKETTVAKRRRPPRSVQSSSRESRNMSYRFLPISGAQRAMGHFAAHPYFGCS